MATTAVRTLAATQPHRRPNAAYSFCTAAVGSSRSAVGGAGVYCIEAALYGALTDRPLACIPPAVCPASCVELRRTLWWELALGQGSSREWHEDLVEFQLFGHLQHLDDKDVALD